VLPVMVDALLGGKPVDAVIVDEDEGPPIGATIRRMDR
jgi:hypothetical protein